MKAIVLADALIGNANLNGMPLDVYNKWQDDRVHALQAVFKKAPDLGAQAIVIAGGLFGSNFIPQRYLDAVAIVLAAFEGAIYYVPYPGELRTATERLDALETLQLLQAPAAIPETGITVKHEADHALATLSFGTEVRTVDLPPLEPLGFGEQSASGFLLVQTEGQRVTSVEELNEPVHPFIAEAIFFNNPESTREMTQEILAATESIDPKSCLRIALRGHVPLHVSYSTGKLLEALGQRFFYLEVADEIEVGDEDAFANEAVSLFGEFLRIIESDDSLSLTEKTRIIRCGRDALNGKVTTL